MKYVFAGQKYRCTADKKYSINAHADMSISKQINFKLNDMSPCALLAVFFGLFLHIIMNYP